MPFALLFGFLVVHVKEQFADSRTHLMPGFRRIHSAIAGVAAVLCAVLLPAIFAWVIGWNPTGFVAITILLFGTILWMRLSTLAWFHCLALFGWLLLLRAGESITVGGCCGLW